MSENEKHEIEKLLTRFLVSSVVRNARPEVITNTIEVLTKLKLRAV